MPSGIATRGRLPSLRPDSYENMRAHVSVAGVDWSQFDGMDEVTRKGDKEMQME